ncbi:MAG TPA: double-strand break repair helicase AddA [Hyphomicrobiaceae bacterium]|nr:double-strand break repair helicase AddA [Hyphomicrobiaceae bacterium]
MISLFNWNRTDTVLDATRRNQGAAADPGSSAWVSANAGTGKTHVLTMRVLRLLLADTAPERILALTYTKAAAAEMSKRVFDHLAGWVTASDRALQGKLRDLLDREPTWDEMQRARQLFAIAIETPGGLKVQTIHAFCERLLQRFPLEAGVAPGFAILDDQERNALLREAIDEVLTEATCKAKSPIAKALQSAIGFATEGDFDVLLAEALRERDWLAAAVRLDEEAAGDFAGAQAIYRVALGLDASASLEDVTQQLDGLLSKAELTRAQGVLASGSATDIKIAAHLSTARKASGAARRIEALQDAFLTAQGEPRKSMMTKPLAAAHPDVEPLLARARDRFAALHAERNRLVLLDAALALLRLGHAVMQRYAQAKARRAALDFDDLIMRASSLLGTSAAVEWVLYKLDGGLDHILVDEAQDTSPVQWQVVRALAEEFFSGTGAREVTRTLFAVGDEKQSIYGFQGAAPHMFADVGKAFAEHAGRAGLPWRNVPLTLSFRSAAPLLQAVDRIFADPVRAPGLTAASEVIRHAVHRAGQAGLIEVWPTEKPEPVKRGEPWSPLDDTSASSPVVRLATRIAGEIDHWLQSKAVLASEGRPIRAGDILILVRKRAPFAPVMVSTLKARGIKVAGADRLMLIDQIAVQDLMALGDFICLPDDDLALAAVLKSPLIGLDDDHLLALAPKRKGSLWQALLATAAGDAAVNAAAERLRGWRARAERVPPFEFYAGLLDREGLRGAMLKRLGPEAAEPLDEFLNKALTYDAGAPPTLLGFLGWLRAGAPEIKRDMEQGRDEVRVMTVHGAKGLEAPIVFLPDTCSTRSGRRPGGLLRLEQATRPSGLPPPFLWPVKGTSRVAAVQLAKADAERAEAEERNRLLYVALTRARDRLYVAGYESAQGAPSPSCWYRLIKDGLNGELREVVGRDGRPVWRIESKQTAKPAAGKGAVVSAAGAMRVPEWAKRAAPPEPLLTVPLSPSRLVPLETDAEGEPKDAPRRRYAEPPPLSPTALADDSRFLRGTLIHALLEHLPTQPQSSWQSAAAAFIAVRGQALPRAARQAIVAETLAVLREPAFAVLFGPDSRAEVAIAAEVPRPDGKGPALRLTGKIDRLASDGDCVLIVDYKTNRPPPASPDRVADAYLLQLAAYRLCVGRIFAGRPVRAAILWTDGPRIMEIPQAALDAYQHRLWQLDPASLDA